jgi:hypothetical protein
VYNEISILKCDQLVRAFRAPLTQSSLLPRFLEYLLQIVEISDNQNNLEVFGHQAAGHTGDKSILKDGTSLYKHYSDRYELLLL